MNSNKTNTFINHIKVLEFDNAAQLLLTYNQQEVTEGYKQCMKQFNLKFILFQF